MFGQPADRHKNVPIWLRHCRRQGVSGSNRPGLAPFPDSSISNPGLAYRASTAHRYFHRGDRGAARRPYSIERAFIMLHLPRRLAAFVAVAGIVAAGLTTAGTPTPVHGQRAPGDCTVDESQTPFDDIEQQLLALLNQYRSDNGAPTLAPSQLLTRAAVWKSAARAAGGPETHDDPDRHFDERFNDCGYDFNAAKSENLAKITGDVPPTRRPGSFWMPGGTRLPTIA
jgi:hypothetical protein